MQNSNKKKISSTCITSIDKKPEILILPLLKKENNTLEIKVNFIIFFYF